MNTVKISDVITPDVWKQYGVQMTTDLNAFLTSGVMQKVDNIVLPNGGATINMPFWNALTGDSETLDDNTPLTVNKTGAGKQVAVIVARGKAWGVNDLAALFAGSDPAMAILKQLAQYWATQNQKELIATVNGAMGAASMASLIENQSTALVDASMMIDAGQRLGDAKGQLTAIAMHSATEAALAKQKLIVYETVDGKTDRVPLYLGKRVVVDDALPLVSGVATTYLFGQGVIGYTANAVGNADVESDRDILAGEDVITMRNRFIMHPMGLKWVGTPAGDFPTRTELGTGANWERVFETKQIPIVALKHKVTA